MGDGMSDEYKEYLAIQPEPELNELEIAFIDSLEKEGYRDVEIQLPYAWDSHYRYSFSFKPPYKLTMQNIDSVKFEIGKISKELFSKKVSNNILYDTKTIWITPYVKSDEIKNPIDSVSYGFNAKKYFVKLGFKVVMNKDSTFSKVYFDSLK